MTDRTIKFRGKSVKSGDWLCGDYIYNREHDFIAPRGVASDDATWEDFEVDPKTVGQFTGLCAEDGTENGTEIYEGDICELVFEYEGIGPNGGVTYEDCIMKGVITYDCGFYFRIDSAEASFKEYIGEEMSLASIPCHGEPANWKVLGNIIDNKNYKPSNDQAMNYDEQEIIALSRGGMAIEEIAEELGIDEPIVAEVLEGEL